MDVEYDYNLPDWKDMKESFLGRFYNRKWKNKILNEIESLKIRKDEPIRSFANVFLRNCNKIGDMSEERKVELFLRGLNRELASLVLTHEKQTMKDIIELIERHEEAKDITDRIEPRRRKRRERYYESESESESEDEIKRKLRKIQSKQNQKKKEEKVEQKDEIEELTEKIAQLKIQMARMNNPGRNYYSQNNRPRIMKCYNCGKEGHMRKDCELPIQPQSWRQNIPNDFNNNNIRNCNQKNNDHRYKPKSKQITHTNYVDTEENDESDEEVTRELIKVLFRKHGRDNDSNSDDNY